MHFSGSVGRMVMEPFRGAPHTVAHIRRVGLDAQKNYQVRLLCEDVIGRLPPKDYLSEILALYYWVCGNTRYCNDPRTIELVRSPTELIGRLTANVSQLRQIASKPDAKSSWKPSLDCDDLSALFVALMLAIGREVRIITVAFADRFVGRQRQYQHVYVQVREPRTGNWIVLDPVAAEDTGEMLRRAKAVKIWPVA